MDGSPVARLSVELEGVADPVLTRVSVVNVGKIGPGSAVGVCLGRRPLGAHPLASAVQRIGVAGESVTLRDGSGVLGCDKGGGGHESGQRWCGRAFGNLYGGHLRDPRLGLECATTAGRPMGFVWVEPQVETTYVGVEQPGYVEVYAVARGLPVRVSTVADVEIRGSRASFRISEHDAAGGLVRRYVLNAAVAG
jgi:hypothetical protein